MNPAVDFFKQIDEAAQKALAGTGIKPPCRMGCNWCCRLPIQATTPEGMLAAEYIRENLDAGEAAALLARIKGWLDWFSKDFQKLAHSGVVPREIYMKHGPGCPFLSGGLCAIYPVRPMGCRVHFSRNEVLCRPDALEPGAFDPPVLIEKVLEAVKPVCLEYRRRLEGRGMDFDENFRLLAELVLINWGK